MPHFGLLTLMALLANATPSLANPFPIPDEFQKMVSTDFEGDVWATPDWTTGPGVESSSQNYSVTEYDIPLANPAVIKVKADPVDSNNKVLYWPIPAGTHSAGRYESKNIDALESWAQYKIYIPDTVKYDVGADQDNSNKLPGFTGGGSGSGNWGPDDGDHGWSARTGWKVTTDGTFEIGYYIYHMDRPSGQAGEWAGWNTTLERNRWYTITEHVKTNSLTDHGPNADGVLEAWVDGQPVFSKTDYRFTAIPDFLKVRAFWLTVYFGGNDKAPKGSDLYFYFDDIQVYRSIDPPAAVIQSLTNPVSKSQNVTLKLTVNETGPYKLWATSEIGNEVFMLNEGENVKGDNTITFPLPSNVSAGFYVLWMTFGNFTSGSSGSEEIKSSVGKLIVE